MIPLECLISLSIGIISAIFSSAPLGPANFWIVDQLLIKKNPTITYFVMGTILSDIAYAYLAFWGYHHYLQSSTLGKAWGVCGSTFLIVLGLVSFNNKPKKHDEKELHSPATRLKEFMMGLFLCAGNPTFILYWIFVSALLVQLGASFNLYTSIFLFVGIALGDVFWYGFLAYVVKRNLARLEEKWANLINKAIAVSFVLFGVMGVYEFIEFK